MLTQKTPLYFKRLETKYEVLKKLIKSCKEKFKNGH